MTGMRDMHVISPRRYPNLTKAFRINAATCLPIGVYGEAYFAGGVTRCAIWGPRRHFDLLPTTRCAGITTAALFAAGKSLHHGGHADPPNGVRDDCRRSGPKRASSSVSRTPRSGSHATRKRRCHQDYRHRGVLTSPERRDPQFTEEGSRASSICERLRFHVAAHAHEPKGMEGYSRRHPRSSTAVMDDGRSSSSRARAWWVPTISAGQLVAAKAEIPAITRGCQGKALAIGLISSRVSRRTRPE